MYKIRRAENNDVDVILDTNLDVVFSSKEALIWEKKEMEKVVNYIEEDIRNNISNYRIVYDENGVIAIYSVNDYLDGIIIDFLYVMPNHRKKGVGKYIIDEIIESNYKCIYTWTYKENEIFMDMLSKKEFKKYDENEYKNFMKSENIKEKNNEIRKRMFEEDVKKMASKYGVEYVIKVL